MRECENEFEEETRRKQEPWRIMVLLPISSWHPSPIDTDPVSASTPTLRAALPKLNPFHPKALSHMPGWEDANGGWEDEEAEEEEEENTLPQR